jgi:hypothetical protein
MFEKSWGTISIRAALVVVLLSATACGTLPLSLAFLQPTGTPTPTDTPTPAPTPTAQAQGKAPNRAPAAQGLAALLRGAGLRGGVVASNDGRALGFTLGKTTAQIRVAPSAIIVVPDKPNATLSDIAVGDRVIVDVTGTGATAVAALVLDLPAHYTANNLRLGAVISNQGGTVNLRTARGTQAVTTSAATRVINLSGAQPAVEALGDLQPANAVLVIGQGSAGSFDAQVIVVLDQNVRTLRRNNRSNPPVPTPTPGA